MASQPFHEGLAIEAQEIVTQGEGNPRSHTKAHEAKHTSNVRVPFVSLRVASWTVFLFVFECLVAEPLTLSPLQRVVEGPGRAHLPAFVGHGDRQNAHAFVAGQR